MSADNGYIIRVNDAGQYVLQMYFLSNDSYPDINHRNANRFDTLDEAKAAYVRIESVDSYPSEYGLTIDLSNEKRKVQMEIGKYVRRPFSVNAVRVTAANIWEVAEWCGGTVTDIHGETYIKVNVKRPLNDDQTKARIGDWVLSTKKGFKVYNDKAFHDNFKSVKTGDITFHQISKGVDPSVDTRRPDLAAAALARLSRAGLG